MAIERLVKWGISIAKYLWHSWFAFLNSLFCKYVNIPIIGIPGKIFLWFVHLVRRLLLHGKVDGAKALKIGSDLLGLGAGLQRKVSEWL